MVFEAIYREAGKRLFLKYYVYSDVNDVFDGFGEFMTFFPPKVHFCGQNGTFLGSLISKGWWYFFFSHPAHNR
jgi:hypothetical protein